MFSFYKLAPLWLNSLCPIWFPFHNHALSHSISDSGSCFQHIQSCLCFSFVAVVRTKVIYLTCGRCLIATYPKTYTRFVLAAEANEAGRALQIPPKGS